VLMAGVDLRSFLRTGRFENPFVCLTRAHGGGGSSLAPAQRSLRNARCSRKYDHRGLQELTH
jgi:hypothetical protein